MTTMRILTWFFSRKPFSEFSLDDEVVSGRLKKLGFTISFEIQDKTLPLTLEGRLAVVHNYAFTVNLIIIIILVIIPGT